MNENRSREVLKALGLSNDCVELALTNQRLNRRLQRTQSKLAKYRWRYLSLKNQVEEHKQWMMRERYALHNLYKEMFKDMYYTVYPWWKIKSYMRGIPVRLSHWWKSKRKGK